MINIIKIILTLALLLPQTAKWEQVENKECGIRFIMPQGVRTYTRLINKIPSTIYETKDETCVFGIVCSNFTNLPEALKDGFVEELYKQLRDGSIYDSSYTLIEENPIPMSGVLAREIEYSHKSTDGKQMTYYKRFIFRKPYVYQINIGAQSRASKMLKKEAEIFFNSIKFSEDK